MQYTRVNEKLFIQKRKHQDYFICLTKMQGLIMILWKFKTNKISKKLMSMMKLI